MEDSVLNSVWAVRVLRYAIRTHKCPRLLPAIDERDFERISGHLLWRIWTISWSSRKHWKSTDATYELS